MLFLTKSKIAPCRVSSDATAIVAHTRDVIRSYYHREAEVCLLGVDSARFRPESARDSATLGACMVECHGKVTATAPIHAPHAQIEARV